MSKTHLPPVVLKNHEARLWVGSAWAGGGGGGGGAAAGPGVQPAKPAHSEPRGRQAKGLTHSKTKGEGTSEYSQKRPGQKNREREGNNKGQDMDREGK